MVLGEVVQNDRLIRSEIPESLSLLHPDNLFFPTFPGEFVLQHDRAGVARGTCSFDDLEAVIYNKSGDYIFAIHYFVDGR